MSKAGEVTLAQIFADIYRSPQPLVRLATVIVDARAGSGRRRRLRQRALLRRGHGRGRQAGLSANLCQQRASRCGLPRPRAVATMRASASRSLRASHFTVQRVVFEQALLRTPSDRLARVGVSHACRRGISSDMFRGLKKYRPFLFALGPHARLDFLCVGRPNSAE